MPEADAIAAVSFDRGRQVAPQVYERLRDAIISLTLPPSTVLSRAERALFQSMTGPVKRRRDWLMGRIAAKEAVRVWVLARQGFALLPADIEIAAEAEGRPVATTPGLDVDLPWISIAHAGGAAVAAAADYPVGADYELLAGVDAVLLAEGGFTEAELATLGHSVESLLGGWCAKEAAAKAAGTGLTGRPKAFALTPMPGGHSVRRPDGSQVSVQVVPHSGAMVALAVG